MAQNMQYIAMIIDLILVSVCLTLGCTDVKGHVIQSNQVRKQTSQIRASYLAVTCP